MKKHLYIIFAVGLTVMWFVWIVAFYYDRLSSEQCVIKSVDGDAILLETEEDVEFEVVDHVVTNACFTHVGGKLTVTVRDGEPVYVVTGWDTTYINVNDGPIPDIMYVWLVIGAGVFAADHLLLKEASSHEDSI